MARKQDKRVGKKGASAGRSSRRSHAPRRPQMPFGKRNYLLLAVGMALVVIGYAIMRIENEVDGFISLYVAPILLIVGYLEVIYAIWWRPQSADAAVDSDQ